MLRLFKRDVRSTLGPIWISPSELHLVGRSMVGAFFFFFFKVLIRVASLPQQNREHTFGRAAVNFSVMH